jgi:hypothetical protein
MIGRGRMLTTSGAGKPHDQASDLMFLRPVSLFEKEKLAH